MGIDASLPKQQLDLGLGLDALGQGLDVQPMPERDRRPDDLRIVRALETLIA